MKRFTSETLVAVVMFASHSYHLAQAIDVGQMACPRACANDASCACEESRCIMDPTFCACSQDSCEGRPLCYTLSVVPSEDAERFGLDPNGDETARVIRTLCTPNLRPVAVLKRLDIDQDGVADISSDTDGDGLPDNWEDGGVEALRADQSETDRVVFYPAPTAIVPGTPPTPIFTRLAVTTSALDPDTDGDGLSDFVEVFGLKFIDENGDGILQSSGNVSQGREWVEDGTCGSLIPGGEIRDLLDLMMAEAAEAILDPEQTMAVPGDGLPSPGECPRDNSGFANGRGRVNADVTSAQPFRLRHDFDGFVFTDPVNRDTDGDGIDDGKDNDPLINPRAFGETGNIIVKFNVEGIDDFDQDGLGNGMDMGNDLLAVDFGAGATGARNFQEIDNPENVIDLLELFRRDLVFVRENGNEVPIANPTVPEAQIEDLLGVDWDGNGLWRTTDVRNWHLVIADGVGSLTECYPLRADLPQTASDPTCPPEDLFTIGARDSVAGVENRIYLFSEQSFSTLQQDWVTAELYGGRAAGLGWQELLQPTGTPTNFLPDRTVWAVLYSWRMPGFDIDGDGFVGVPNLSNTAQDGAFRVFLEETDAANPGLEMGNLPRNQDETNLPQVDDYIAIPEQRRSAGDGELDGRITVDSLCGATAAIWTSLIFMGLCSMLLRHRVKWA